MVSLLITLSNLLHSNLLERVDVLDTPIGVLLGNAADRFAAQAFPKELTLQAPWLYLCVCASDMHCSWLACVSQQVSGTGLTASSAAYFCICHISKKVLSPTIPLHLQVQACAGEFSRDLPGHFKLRRKPTNISDKKENIREGMGSDMKDRSEILTDLVSNIARSSQRINAERFR